MLQATYLGEPGRTDLWSEGSCSAGNQTFCRPKGSEYACVGCDFPQLGDIKLLQSTLNTAAGLLGIAYRVAVDGQIGVRTTYLVGLVGIKMVGVIAASPEVEVAIGVARTSCKSPDPTKAECTQLAVHQVAVTVPGLIAYFAKPASSKQGGSTDLPVPGQPPTTLPGSLPITTNKGKVAVGFLGGLMFVAAGIGIGYANRSKVRKKR
jgi:hypothetical protein